jgi:hypothetical protein
VLDQLAKTGYVEVADTLIQIMEDPKESDAVKLYAVRGLRDLFALQHLQPPPPILITADKKREARCIAALHKFVNRPSPLSERASDAEIDGFRWVRREAIIGLGLTVYPWMLDDNRKHTGEPTAYDLLRVCCKNDFAPEPSLKEQIEAAVALCQLQPRRTTGYQVDYAAYYLCWFLRDFAMEYIADPDHKTQAWQYQALRLTQALQNFKDEVERVRTEDRAAHKYVNDLITKFEPILHTIEIKQAPDTANLKTWLEEHAPQGKSSLFKDEPKYKLKPPPEVTP